MNNYYQPYNLPSQYGVNAYQYQQPQVICKVVESEDVVRTSEVPFGGIGIFPKADQSVIYIKRWKLDATTEINIYYPASEINDEHEDTLSSINMALQELSNKIDSIGKPQRREVFDYE